MKKRKSKILNFSILALCLACLAFGVYALKNATLTVNGTVGFTAHDCMVSVASTIMNDAVELNEETNKLEPNQHGAPSEERTLFETIETLGGASQDDWEMERAVGAIYFTDLTETGDVAIITMKFTITNKSAYPVYAKITNATIEGVTTNVTGDGSVMQKANAEDDSDVAVLTATFELNKTYTDDLINGEYLPMESLPFEVKLEFGKYTEPVNNDSQVNISETELPQNREECNLIYENKNYELYYLDSNPENFVGAPETAVDAVMAVYNELDPENNLSPVNIYYFFANSDDASSFYNSIKSAIENAGYTIVINGNTVAYNTFTM